MRYLLYILCFIPAIAAAQSQAKAEQVFKRFATFYNARQFDSMSTMFLGPKNTESAKRQNKESMQSWINQLGDLKNFEYIGIDNDDPDHVFVFKTEWTKKGWITSSFSLGKVNTFLDFRLNTRSDGIDKLLKNKK